MRAGGMAGEEDAVAPAAMFGDVVVHPGERAGGILDKDGEAHGGIFAEVRNHRHEATLRQRRADEAEILLPPRRPAPAVEEHDDVTRFWCGPGGHIDVELVERAGAIGGVANLIPAGQPRGQVD